MIGYASAVRWSGWVLLLLPVVSMAADGVHDTTPEPMLPAITLPVQQVTASVPTVVQPVNVGKSIVDPAVNAVTTGFNTLAVAGQSAAVQDKFSFGDAPDSLLFTKDQIATMKSVLRTHESGVVPTTEAVSEVVELAETPVIDEPSSYPVFYLASIVYHDANDWTIWVAKDGSAAPASAAALTATPTLVSVPAVKGKPINSTPVPAEIAPASSLLRITPKANTGELKVVRVSANQADFVWKPTYMAVIKQRVAEQKFAPVDFIKHRVVSTANVKYDAPTDSVYFTLRQNQSFSAAYFNGFEGKLAPKALAPLGAAAEESTLSSAGDTVKKRIDASVSTLDSLLAAQQMNKNK